jgi:hypothetical protein
VALLLLHRPLLQSVLGLGLKVAASRAGFALQVQVSGNLFTHLRLENVTLFPKQLPHPTLNRLTLRRAEFHYSPWRLAWSGPGEFIELYELESAQVSLRATPSPAKPKEPTSASRSLPEILEAFLAQPALYSDAVLITDVNLEVEGGETLRSLRGFSVSAQPGTPGTLSVSSLVLGNGTALGPWGASTSYEERDLKLTGLQIQPGLELTELRFDASERSRGRGLLAVKLRLLEGNLVAQVLLQKDSQTGEPRLRLEFSANHFSLAEAAKLAGLPHSTLPEIGWAESHLQGNPKVPSSWKGQADVQIRVPLAAPLEPLVAELHAGFSAGKIEIDSLNAYSGTTTAAINGAVSLPPTLATLTQSRGTLSLQANTEDLSVWAPLVGISPLSGTCQLLGNLSFDGQLATATLTLDADAPGSGPIQFSRGHLETRIQAPLASLSQRELWQGQLALNLAQPSVQTPQWGASFSEITARANLSEGSILLQPSALMQGANRIEVSGEIGIRAGQKPPLRLALKAACPRLAELGLSIREQPVSGSLFADASTQGSEGERQSAVRITAGPLAWGGFDLGKLEVDGAIAGGSLSLEKLVLRWSDQERLEAGGRVGLDGSHPYSGHAEVQLSRLERFTPLLAQMGIDATVSGKAEGEWNGEGTFSPLQGKGQWKFSIQAGRWKNIQLNEFLTQGSYEPGHLRAAPLRLATPHTRLSAQVDWEAQTLKVSALALEQWGHPVLSGFFLLPLEWTPQGARWSPEGRISGQLHAERLDIATLFPAPGTPTPLAGSLQFHLELSGTPTLPSLDFRLSGRELRSPAQPRLGNAELDVQARYQSGVMTGDATLRSKLEAPLQAQVRIPVALGDLLQGKIAPEQVSGEAQIRIQNGKLNALPALWPALKKSEGSFSFETRFSGSLEKPRWRGSLSLDAPVIHFVSYRFPAISDLKTVLDFEEREIRLRELKADLGGGNLHASGTVRMEPNQSPLLDFQATAKEVLAVRSRSLLLRLDGDLRVKGPLQAATISGQVFATKSRVTQNIDLLPVQLLKKSALPIPQSPPGKPWFTFQKAPLSDWKWDVSLRAKPGETVQIRGNRMKGTAEAYLTMRGTGAAPTLDGSYRTSDLRIFMPFARIDVSRGNLWYFPNQPFRPQLDFSAETDVRNHRVRIYLWGTPEVPRITLNSDPPLNEPDLLSLLSTGVLPGDTSETSQAMAGRAAALLFQELQGKVLDPGGARESFGRLDRFSLNIGALNNRTGHQETRLTYQINDRFFAIGELGANGDFGGQIKYLIRFR